MHTDLNAASSQVYFSLEVVVTTVLHMAQDVTAGTKCTIIEEMHMTAADCALINFFNSLESYVKLC